MILRMRERLKLFTVLMYLALSFAALFPAILNFSHYKYGPNINGTGSDSYSLLKDLWWRSEGKSSAYNVGGKFVLEGFPYSIAPMEENQLPFLLALAFTKISNPVAGYNVSVLIGFLFTFLATHLLALRLLDDLHLAVLASVLFTVTSFHIYQAADHLDLSYVGIVPLFAWLTFVLFEKKWDVFWPMMVALAALSSFIHPYYTVILCLFLGLFVLFNFNLQWLKEKNFYSSAVAAMGLSFLLVKLWQKSYGEAGENVFSLKRDISDLQTYSLGWLDYLCPPAYSFFFPQAAEWKLKMTEASGSNLAENSLYLGILPLLLVPYGLLKMRAELKPFFFSLKGKLLAALALAGLLFSQKAPAWLIFQVLPQFRTISRVGLLVMLATALFTAFVIKEKTRFAQWGAKLKTVVLLGLVLVIFLDQGHWHTPFYSDTTAVPAVYKVVEKVVPPEATILELPYVWGFIPTYWMTRLKRRNFYVFDQNSLNTQLVLKADLRSAQGLKQFSKDHKIDYVIIHSNKKIPGLSGEINNEVNEQTIFFKDAFYSYVLKM